MNESYVTVIGNLTADLVLRTTKNGKPFATFRMASTPRRWDGREQAYVDGGTNFVSVVTFNALAANVVASLAKGQPAIVYGRLRVNTWSTAEEELDLGRDRRLPRGPRPHSGPVSLHQGRPGTVRHDRPACVTGDPARVSRGLRGAG